jgi:cytochrome P450
MESKSLAPSWGLTEFDPWDRRITYDNIWGMYSAMRSETPVAFSPKWGGFWSLTRCDDVRSAAFDWRTFSSAAGAAIPRRDSSSSIGGAPIGMDPPDHTKFRKIMADPFLARRVGQFEAIVQRHIEALLDPLEGKAQADVVRSVTRAFPARVIADILGFGPAAAETNLRLTEQLFETSAEQSGAILAEYEQFLIAEIQSRRTNPAEDYLTELCTMEVDGQPFSLEDLISITAAFGIAGHHTTINGSTSMLLRAAEPAVKQAFWDDPGVVSRIVEETLRIDAPIHLEGRTTTRDVELHGVTIPADSSVALIFGAANRDDNAFPEPNSFRLDRPQGHLAFGHGIHLCLGMNLARLEMAVLLRAFFTRFPNYTIAAPPVGTGMTFGHHMGWSSAPVELY